MTDINWTPLRRACASCRAAGTLPPLWWRDDDAIAPTAMLDQLAGLAEKVQLPVHLAVIPAHASPALADYCASAPMLPVVHGWAHTDHSQGAEKKNEFLTERPDATEDSMSALAHMRMLFGSRLCPMFVPPWNRIQPDVIAALPGQGYRALSTFGPRHTREAVADLVQINTHIDPIWWKGGRDLITPEELVTQAATHLKRCNTGQVDATEPFGLLTHHLVHTPAIWSFAEAFLTEMQMSGAQPWQMETRIEQT